MEAFRYKLEKRPIFERLQLRLLARFARRRSDKILCFRWNSIIRECFRDLIEQPLINRTAQWHKVSALISEQRFAKKLAHFSVDFPRTEVVIIEKNLEASGGHFVVVGKGHERFFLCSERFGGSRHVRQTLGRFLRERSHAEARNAFEPAGA